MISYICIILFIQCNSIRIMSVQYSIIIPVYNGEQCIRRCLDSIYGQGLKEEDFEVICVNDASTDGTAQVVLEYGDSHRNLKLINHETNRRQGAGRNTGVKAAVGDYILYLDADDTFCPHALPMLKEELGKYKDLDILKFDYILVKEGKEKECVAHSDSQDVMTGREFIQRNAIPWVPWMCTYRRRFLVENDLFFEENVLFEDADYVMNSIRHASRIKYASIIVYRYEIYETQTSQINADICKIRGLFELNRRIQLLAQDEEKYDINVAGIINGHYEFRYKNIILRYWWRLPYQDRKELLMHYKPIQPCNDKLISFIGSYPTLFLMLSAAAKPFLPGLRFIYLKLKGKNI